MNSLLILNKSTMIEHNKHACLMFARIALRVHVSYKSMKDAQCQRSSSRNAIEHTDVFYSLIDKRL
jgi:hypothetical protein